MGRAQVHAEGAAGGGRHIVDLLADVGVAEPQPGAREPAAIRDEGATEVRVVDDGEAVDAPRVQERIAAAE